MSFSGNLPNISFTDGTGAATMSLMVPRFSNWTPDALDVKAEEASLGTGITYIWTYRRDYYASFECPNIRPINVPVMLRLKLWLEAGNTVTVQTYDVNSAVYTAYMREKKPPTIKYDKKLMEYTLTLNLLNSAQSPFTASYMSS